MDDFDKSFGERRRPARAAFAAAAGLWGAPPPERTKPDGTSSDFAMPPDHGMAVDYAALAEFRFLLRGFVEFSEVAARAAGLTPRQHQALLQIKGFPAGQAMAVGALAARLHVRHHSAVELVDRLEQAGLITRFADRADRRRVLIRLTPKAEALLAGLALAHQQELQRLGPSLSSLLEKFSPPTA
ncbi:MAG: MarR family transcriptional regulator [Acidibrevibacterium sp.]|uniref:MarR family transcriptional regulator n=1 Tax=Acidibrevibacterium fodinaquatile TaxID=1969806 RepID=UPI0023A86DAD|nr:helix-turn-helix domain-containing protein [Acidibrevibacterium fodinaquatile]MCA7120397.1 MarR family transcriptional regulator [Acidibrevibacterium fodinaquatile]